MATLSSSGVEIAYEAHGAGTPILWTHGYSASTAMWRGQVEAFAGDHQVIVWDMRGHGRTASPEAGDEYSEAKTVADMAAVLDAVGAQQAVIAGLSLGGYATLAFHLAHPERCLAVILCDTGPGYRNDKARDGWNETAERRAVAFETRGLEALGRSPEVLASQHSDARGLANAARGMLKQFDARVIESLPSIAVPTLIIVGENDTPYRAGSDYMANKIPGARLVVIPNAGHSSNIDQPEAFNAAVRDFLSDNGL
jgi:pimeloyl-ACP methyl ester carboxylesterase